MAAVPRQVELNTARPRESARTELREALISACESLYRVELLCEELGEPVPPSLRRAHAGVRAELRRLERSRQR